MVSAHGLALKRAHFSRLLEPEAPGVDWFELISENFFSDGGRPWAVATRLRRDCPLALHGTAMGLGNADGVDPEYIEALAKLVERIEPVRVSDHLCFVGADGEHSHELLPLPHSAEAVTVAADNILQVQDRLKRRILIENPSTYLTLSPSEMSEADFLIEVAERADCAILLDLNNVRVNAHNHGFSIESYLQRIPPHRVEEYHLAGATQEGDLLIDSHIGPVPEAVWAIYRQALAAIGPRPTLVEWDTDTPDFETTRREAEQARSIEVEYLAERAA